MSGVDRRTTAQASYRISQRIRKRVEELFWLGQNGGRIATQPLSGPGAQ
jgi:hypothetical protein